MAVLCNEEWHRSFFTSRLVLPYSPSSRLGRVRLGWVGLGMGWHEG